MKKVILLLILCIMVISFSACGKSEGTEENAAIEKEELDTNSTISKETIEKNTVEQPESKVSTENINAPIKNIVSELLENSEKELDPYVGEYNSYDINEPDLEIQKNEDGTYKIQIGIYRLLFLDKCMGYATESGIEFSTTECNDTEINGIITLNGEDEDGFKVAKVTFTSEYFRNYSSINEYEYYKVSDIPDIYEYDSYEGDDEDEDSLEDDTYVEVDLEGLVYPYDYLEADDPRVQQLMRNWDEDYFRCEIFINGLVGYTPESSISGGLTYFYKDEEFIIDENIGKGLFQSEQLAVVQDNIRKMLMEIVRVKGENAMEYQEYFSDQAMLENIQTFMNNEIEDDWQILDGFYLTAYSGNTNILSWGEENRKTLTDTDTHYNMGFSFYADYRAMGCNEDEEEAAVHINCSISKETGLIDELVIEKSYMEKSFFEIMRF